MRYVKKRKYVQAVRWTGEVTPELVALLGDCKFLIEQSPVGENCRVALGNGLYADIGDWIVLDDGEILRVIGDEAFARIFEEAFDLSIEAEVMRLRERLDN